MYTLGIDIGSSFIKASVYDAESRSYLSKAQVPDLEMPVIAERKGWAEQSPETWWEYTKSAIKQAVSKAPIPGNEIRAIGITYQMHGLVCIDREGNPLMPSIIWCDSRAVETGTYLEKLLGAEYCHKNLLNSPGNFTASKLCWVLKNKPELTEKIYRIMLPGDYIAFKLSGEMNTTVGGLSEGIFWDFRNNRVSEELIKASGIPVEIIPRIVPVFGEQGRLIAEAASELGLKCGIPVSYRSGDQPNNAFSLNVNEPGEIAATAGTSGVIYAVTDRMVYDTFSRVNTFAHVNHSETEPRLGILLCINGTGILNSWLRKNICHAMDYNAMNELAMRIPAGSEGLMVLPFGNGAERVLRNQDPGCQVLGLNFNIHSRPHLLRAAQEGIAFALNYGMEIMRDSGIDISVIRAGHANMFLSPVFRETLANTADVTIELYETDGSAGAAIGAAIGAGYYSGVQEAFKGNTSIATIEPGNDKNACDESYQRWKNQLLKTCPGICDEII